MNLPSSPPVHFFDVNLRGRLIALGLETPALKFLKAASLTGTSAGGARALVSGYPVFRQPGGATQLLLKLPEGAWTHLTLSLDDARSKPIPITAILLHEEESEAPPPEISRTMSLVFFGVLALVVAVLMVVIVQLLPKPANSG